MHPVRRIEARIAELKAADLWREPRHGVAGGLGEQQKEELGEPPSPAGLGGPGGGGALSALLDTRSNDYLGLARSPVSRETLESLAEVGAGSSGSRLVSGTTGAHLELEGALADWLGREAALFFSSAFAANCGALAALAGPGDLILSDALNHASLVDGCRLSRARVQVVPHRDLAALADALRQPFEACWVVTESYFGMDADVPELGRIAELCQTHQAGLFVDEAHALGVFGPGGRGLCVEAGVVPDVLSGGLGKAFGLEGGFVACSGQLAGWLWNRARSFVFSTAPSPLICSLALERLARIRAAAPARAHLVDLERRLAQRLEEAGLPVPPGRRGPIFPVLSGSPSQTLAAAQELHAQGVLCQPIRPPTVPPGGSRLRVNLRAEMSLTDVDRLAEALCRSLRRGPEQITARAAESGEPPPGAVAAGRFDPRLSSMAAGEPAGSSRPWPGATAGDAAAPELAPASSPGGVQALIGKDPPGGGGGRQPASTPGGTLPLVSAAPLGRGGHQPASAPGGVPSRTGSAPVPETWVILGTGTGIGKTYVAEGMLRMLAGKGHAAAGLKPIETGVTASSSPRACDAERLQRASFHVKHPTPHPLYALPDPVAPSLAARRSGQSIDLEAVSEWLRRTSLIEGASAAGRIILVIETAGGVFSPLSSITTNFDLARRAEPARWVLVAPDRLGVLHDVGACWAAMKALGRTPDFLVLSAPEMADPSTGTNAAELISLGLPVRIVTLPRGDLTPLAALLAPPPP